MDYRSAVARMDERADELLAGHDDRQTVFTVEHPPTITIGKNGTADHVVAPAEVLARRGFQVYEVDRGGDVTYHGPGQLVVYPVLHLSPWGNDVGRYVRMLEETVIVALADVGIAGSRIEGLPGVWVGTDKVCAIGARVRRRKTGEFVTSHGLALNVHTDLSHFQTIIPCGIADKGVTSVERLLGQEASLAEWEGRLRTAFTQIFDMPAVDAGVVAEQGGEAS
ncbi:MAG: lipoyl(octanoyl) transferase LipB [Alicyclobacillus sp.]|nr:lipoyl(octanoyl) transferase LipB [Alicyclobacillus sp.]